MQICSPASDIDGDGYDNDGHDLTGNSRGHDDDDGRDRTGNSRGHDDAPQGPGRHCARANGDKQDLDPTEEFHDDKLGEVATDDRWFDFDNLPEIDSDIKFSFMTDTERLVSEGRLTKTQAKKLKRKLKDLEV